MDLKSGDKIMVFTPYRYGGGLRRDAWVPGVIDGLYNGGASISYRIAADFVPRCMSFETAHGGYMRPATSVEVRKGISSMQLAKEIGVTQKTAWFMLGRLREACSAPDSIDKLKGIIEIDEAFFGGKDANKHAHLRAGRRGGKGKTAVLGMRERGGKTRGMVIADRTIHTIQQHIHANVEVGATIYTDEGVAYQDLNGLFFRADSVNHSQGEYTKGACHTNSIESVWAVLKRGVYGVYHQVSAKHLGRYVNEFAFRLNEGNVARHSLERLDSFVDAVVGKRLTYARLIA